MMNIETHVDPDAPDWLKKAVAASLDPNLNEAAKPQLAAGLREWADRLRTHAGTDGANHRPAAAALAEFVALLAEMPVTASAWPLDRVQAAAADLDLPGGTNWAAMAYLLAKHEPDWPGKEAGKTAAPKWAAEQTAGERPNLPR